VTDLQPAGYLSMKLPPNPPFLYGQNLVPGSSLMPTSYYYKARWLSDSQYLYSYNSYAKFHQANIKATRIITKDTTATVFSNPATSRSAADTSRIGMCHPQCSPPMEYVTHV